MSKAKWKEFRDLYWEFLEKYTCLEKLILTEGYWICGSGKETTLKKRKIGDENE